MKKILHALGYAFVFLVLVAFDFFTKKWALATLARPLVINSFFSYELTMNRGISWGFFHQAPEIFYGTLSGIIACMIMALAAYTYTRFMHGYNVLCETLVLAGACGNLLDRFLYGGVVDFILVSYAGYSLPIFNSADAIIVCGTVCAMFVHYVSSSRT